MSEIHAQISPSPAQAALRPLFRQEAVQFQDHDRHWGQVVPLQSLSTTLLVWLVMAAVGGIFTFLWFAEYARKESVLGYLEPAGGTVKVIAAKAGVITSLLVEQGQSVIVGQPLMKVSLSQVGVNGEDIDGTILTTLDAQRDSLQQQLLAEAEHETSERNRLIAQKQSTEMELHFFGEELTIQTQRVHVGELLLSTAQLLSQKGLMTEVEQHRREDSLLEQKQRLINLTEGVVTRQGKLTELEYTLAQLATVMANKAQPLRNELSSVEQRITEVKGRRAYLIRAPIAGRIGMLQATIGQSVDTQHPQMQILPGGQLHAEMFIPARAIGFVHTGQDVRIQYDAFPYQNYGTYHGHIESVSQTMLSGNEPAGPLTLKEAAYRATVLLDRPDVDAAGRKIALQPDMTLRADIILDRHTLMQWIIRPILLTIRFGR